MANFDPTAANIIASLGVKGATVGKTTGSQYQGYVPVLDANGMLSANLIPANAAQAAIPALSNVVYIDPYTTVDSSVRKGSIVAPYKSLSEAAQNFVPTEDALATTNGSTILNHLAFVLAPGKYTDISVTFNESRKPLNFYLIGTGKCLFSSNVVSFSGMASQVPGNRPCVWLQNISTTGTISIVGNNDIYVICNSEVGQLNGNDGTTLKLSSDSRVSSTNILSVSYLTDDAHIVNTSTVIGTTVKDALSRLGDRKVRISKVTADSSGFDIDSSSSYVDVSAESSDGTDLFDLRERDRVFVEGINKLFQKSKDLVVDTVTANTITADVANITELNMSYLKLGGYKLSVDTYGYLVVNDGSVNPPQPPQNVVLLSDTVTGTIYMIGVTSGRMYIAPADIDSSSDSSSSSVQEVLTVYDPKTGYTYAISVQNGRLIITRIGA